MERKGKEEKLIQIPGNYNATITKYNSLKKIQKLLLVIISNA